MVEKREVYLSCFDTMRTLHIYTPMGYERGRKKYPVIYMYDGHNLFFDEDATYGKSWGLKEYLDHSDLEVIIVGIECNHEGNMRLEEFSPYDFEDAYIGHIQGRGQILMEWVVKDLKPWIDKQYRTKKARAYTGIAGSSMGGLMALYTILHHNDTFSMAGCFSSFLYPLMEDIKKEIMDAHLSSSRVFISWGSDEFRSKTALSYGTQRNLWITNALLQRDIEVFPYQHIKGKHNEASWENELPYAFPFLLNKK